MRAASENFTRAQFCAQGASAQPLDDLHLQGSSGQQGAESRACYGPTPRKAVA
jgi:hypothetical protein